MSLYPLIRLQRWSTFYSENHRLRFLLNTSAFSLCNFVHTGVLPCPYAIMISLRWPTLRIAQWEVILTAICSCTALTLL